MVSAIALSTFALVKMSGSTAYRADYPPGEICLTYDEGGSDCGFTSYAGYLEAESGIGDVVFDNTACDGERTRIQGNRPALLTRGVSDEKRRTDPKIFTAFGFYFGKAADGLNNFSPLI